MYQALGRSVRRNPDNTFTVRVEIIDDRISKSVRFQSYTVSTMQELRAAVTVDLQALRASEQDAALNAAVVDIVIAQL